MLSRRELVRKLAVGAAVAKIANLGLPKAVSALEVPSPPLGVGAYNPAAVADVPAVAAPAGLAVRAVADQGVGLADTASMSAPWDLVRPLTLGSRVAHGWRLAGLTGVADGSCVLTLRNVRGRTQRLHLCRNDGRPQGLVYTDRFDLVVMNGGQGDLPTEEGLAQAVAALAHRLAANERNRGDEALVVALLPQAERERRFSGSMDWRLR